LVFILSVLKLQQVCFGFYFKRTEITANMLEHSCGFNFISDSLKGQRAEKEQCGAFKDFY